MVRVHLHTPLGIITLRLATDRAPLSAAGFLAHIDAGLYGGASFYRASRPDTEIWPDHPAVLLQGGLGFHGGSPLPTIPHEGPDITGLHPDFGTVAFARNEPGTACSEFFLNLADNRALRPGGGRGDNLGIAVFGHVETGIEIAQAILAGPAGTDDESYPEPVRRQILNPSIPILTAQRG